MVQDEMKKIMSNVYRIRENENSLIMGAQYEVDNDIESNK